MGRIGLRARIANDPAKQAIADDLSLTPTKAGELLGESRTTICRYRAQSAGKRADVVTKKAQAKAKAEDDLINRSMSATGTDNDMIVDTGDLDAPIDLDEPITAETGWAPVLRKLGFGDPENWTIVGEVRMATWEQSARSKDGDRDRIRLWSYRARVIRKTEEEYFAEEDLDAAVKRMKTKRYSIIRPVKGVTLGPPVGYCHHQGDEQAGKNRNGGGIANLEERENTVLQKSVDAISGYLKMGVNITEILDNAAGDRVENITGHYASQGRTTNSMREQINYAVESDVARTEVLAAFGLPITKVYTPSNHGEMRTVTSGPHQSSESDNWDLIIAEMVKRVIDRSPIADQITWLIPHDAPFTRYHFMGVGIASTHGHKADKQGRLYNWIKNQQGSMLMHKDFRPNVMLMGHKHHFHMEDVSGTMMIQTGSLDDGSEYFANARGDIATGGAVGLLVGDIYPTGVSRVEPL